MNELAAVIVDLVRLAESPLYPTYRWVGREVGGRNVEWSEFLAAVKDGMRSRTLRLWCVGSPSGQRRELFDIPDDLERRYRVEPELDDRYDPFGLSLTIGSAIETTVGPDWSFDVDFVAGTFTIAASHRSTNEAVDHLGLCYPDYRIIVGATTVVDDTVLIHGTIARRPGNGALG